MVLFKAINERNFMKKIFYLCMIVILGSHSMQAIFNAHPTGLMQTRVTVNDAFDQIFKCAAPVTKGAFAILHCYSAIRCYMIFDDLYSSLLASKSTQPAEIYVKNTSPDLELAVNAMKNMGNKNKLERVEGMLISGALTAGYFYLSCKLAHSALKDVGLVERKEREAKRKSKRSKEELGSISPEG